jgi:hypothetical protein
MWTVRHKLIRARGTGKFVVLFQLMGVQPHQREHKSAIAAAVAEKPEGPYQWHGILEYDGKRVYGADTAVFTDDDSSQYLITGQHKIGIPKPNPQSPGGPTVVFTDDDGRILPQNLPSPVADWLYQLTPDCLHVEKAKKLGTGGEAPAIFKHDGVYYLLHSHLTWLYVNDNFYHTATDIWGPWEKKGNIAQGQHSDKTFMTQTMDVVPVAGKKGAFIWIGNSIRGTATPDIRTVWLPVTLKGKGEMEIRWRDAWDLSVFDEAR